MTSLSTCIRCFITLICFCFLYLPHTVHSQSSDIPAPEELLGFKVGADFHLATYEQSIAYFKKLDSLSDFIQMQYAGETSEGRPWYFAIISTPENIKNIDRYKEISQRLAHPKGLSKEDAKALAKEGKPIVHIDGGLHASEVAGAQHTISLAYEILSKRNEEEMSRILDDVILLLWPSLNPDGQDIIANWYLENVGTPYEVSPVPWLYQKYVGHDNNRDAYMLNMVESRVVARNWREWEPNIIHVHHQSSPFPTRIWLPPFAEPIASQTPPLVAREVNMIGMAIAQRLETEGLKGAVHMGKGFDAWYPGYIDYLPAMQNIPSFWTETALYRYATPHLYTLSDYPDDRKEFRVESLYTSPWEGGWWRLGDAVQYMQTASMAVLDYASKYGDILLFNKYQSATQVIEKYKKQPPFAYFIPQKQDDPVRPVELLRRLAFNGIQVMQLEKSITFDGITHDAGTWVIPMDQEFAELARQVFEVQSYPDLREFPDGPLEQPYDAAGWTLPLQFDVEVIPASSPLTDELRGAMQPVKGDALDWKETPDNDLSKLDFLAGTGFNSDSVAAGIIPLSGSISGSGGHLILRTEENNSYRVLADAFDKGLAVSYVKNINRYAISGASKSQVNSWVNDFAINGMLQSGIQGTKITPRVALYDPWVASMDMGWTRWLLDHYGIKYTRIRNSDFQAGNLRNRFDIILFGSERPGVIQEGYKRGEAPKQYIGGIGESGIRQLNEFVTTGGTLVCLNESSNFAIENLFLPVKNVVKDLDRKHFFTGGSIMEVIMNADHPVMSGMDHRASIFVSQSPVFTTLDGFEGEALAKYQKNGSPLQSGYLLGSEYMNDFAAALDVKHGEGHVLLFGFRPQWRGQPMGTYKTLFNALLYTKDVASSHIATENFWSPPVRNKEEKEKTTAVQ